MSDSDHGRELTTSLGPTPNLPAWMAGITGRLDEAMAAGEIIIKSGFAPKGYTSPQAVVVACAMGARLGLDPFSAMAGIAVVNGRPTLYGDSMLAVCQNHPAWAGMLVEWDGEGDDVTCTVTVSRKGLPDYSGRFSIREAKTAQLWNKQGPWSNHPRRMLEMRARNYALRGQFADALAGFACHEVEADLVEAEATVVRTDPAPAVRRTVVRSPAVEMPAGEAGDDARDADANGEAEDQAPADAPPETLAGVVEQALKDLGGQRKAAAVLGPVAKAHGLAKFTEAAPELHQQLITDIRAAVTAAIGGAA